MEQTVQGFTNRGKFRRAALKGYMSRLSNSDDRILYDDGIADILAEQGITWKYDPRSVYEPEQLFTALERYGKQNSPRYHWDEHLEAGWKLAFKVFAKPKNYEGLEPITDEMVLKSHIKLEKSSGLPALTSKDKDWPYAIDREYQVRKGIKKAPNPCIAYKRTQAGNKTRLVWGYPLEMTIMEARFARPLIENFLQRRRTTMAFGMTKLDLGVAIEHNISRKGKVYCLDYSKFDSSISARFIHRSFDILSTWFTQKDMEELGWDQMVKYFVCTPIVMPDGNLYTGKTHGVPSGSYFTQLIDSIVNTALVGAILSKFGENADWKNIFVLGDDSIFSMKKRVKLEVIASQLASYGITMNVEKSTVDAVHFLGATWEKGRPRRPVEELGARAVYPETFRKYSQDRDQRKREQLAVLVSLATQYRDGFQLVKKLIVPQFDTTGVDFLTRIRKDMFLSGSEKYRREYVFEDRPRSFANFIRRSWL